MRTIRFTKPGLLIAASALLLCSSLAHASKDAGHSKDCRTFHSNGQIAFGEIQDPTMPI